MNCPNCNSQDVKCYRKKQNDPGCEQARDILCVCQTCGYKYKQTRKPVRQVSSSSSVVSEKVSDGKIRPEGVTGWIFTLVFWPFALTKWFYNTNKVRIEKPIKAGIIAVVWALIAVLFGWLILRPSYDLPKIVLDRTVTEKREVSTAQFATTTVPATSVAPETTGETTTIPSIFLQ